SLYYGVLIFLSKGYSPDKGRLHTCYAPVRRSQSPEGLLPLGLHVLGLPLAFILSQDQTLHCMFVCPYSKKKLIDALVFPYFLVVICMSMISILLALTPVACFICHAASELRVQKYELFFNWQNILEK